MRYWAVVFLAIGCSSSTPTQPTRGHPNQPDGAHCNAGMECASGVCEGEGCAAGQGVCASRERICTEDMSEFCGCDGKVFHGSSSCPGERFQNRGACTADRPVQGDGASCNSGRECASGVCEGEGCGDVKGVCKPKNRICTDDVVEFCGCDSQVFRGSSTCPRQRYQHRGSCTPTVDPGPTDHPVQGDGASCNSGLECASGVCEGEGCGDIKGVCKPKTRICTRNIVEYCGCDGKTFGASGTCPSQRYASRGACPGK